MNGTDGMRRALFLGAIALFAAGCGKRQAAPPQAGSAGGGAEATGEYVYVSNEDSRNITVIDATTDSVVSTIEVGTRPRGVKVSPDGRTEIGRAHV